MLRPGASLILLALYAAGCSGPADQSPAPSAEGAPPGTAASAASTQVIGRAPSGSLVTLEPVEGALPLPEGGAVMDQFSKAFVPDTLFVRVGQPVTFKNSEDQLHNVTVIRSRTGTGVFNISQNQGELHTHTFEQAGEYEVSCDVHPGMRAVIVATTTPYAMFAEQGGTFAFQHVTPGQYRLRVTVGGRVTERVVQVSGARLDLGGGGAGG
jgi:plastocyanin